MVGISKFNRLLSPYVVFFRSALTIIVITVIGLLSGVFAPHAALAQNTPHTDQDTCADVRYLMQRQVTPDTLLQGGGTLNPGQTVTGTVGPDDMGDHWSFVVTGATNNTTMTVTFANIPAGIALEMGLFRGTVRMTGGNNYQPVLSGQSYTLSTPRNGAYTLVVQLAHVSALGGMNQNQQYQMTTNFNGNGDVAAELGSHRFRDDLTSKDYAYTLRDGKQIITFSSGAEFR
ncbi:MAG: hypothetical protein K8I60_03330, partial [Anaerolineae bacterium]|nr:hypothetical protein [Anaerolineae bacterium]